MQLGTHRHGKCLGLAALALALACLPLTACGGGGGGDPTPPEPPAPVPLTVSATPAGMNSDAGSTVDVTLAAAGDGSATAKIYYTVDLSVPLAGEPGTTEYVAGTPVTITQDTVLKFYAAPTTGDPTAVSMEGYTFATAPGILYDWTQSGHGAIAAEAWRHWDADGEVQESCAKCHAGDGFMDWADNGVVDAPAPLPMGLACTGCHGDPFLPGTLYADLTAYPALEPVEFPSGAELSLFNSSNLCMACHQGRASGVSVETATPNTVVQDPDYDSYSFINIHYFAAAASYFGEEANGGYEYSGLAYPTPYTARNTFPSHYDDSGTTPVRVLSDCVGCHMGDSAPHDHTWMPDIADCQACHTGATFQQLSGSPASNYAAIQGAITQLYAAIQTYATNLGYPVVYDDHAYPYFFNDNGQGAVYANAYGNFDKTLLQAAYNYQFAQKEPCGYIHNGTYMRQLLFDSIYDLGGTPADLPPGRPGFTPSSNMFAAKTEQFHTSGHDNLAGEAFRHWDPDYADPGYDPTDPVVVQGSCQKCHSTLGFVYYATSDMLATDVKVGEGVGCFACHNQANLFGDDVTRYDAQPDNAALLLVEFPETGVSLTLNDSSNMCLVCHQGRSSMEDVVAKFASAPPWSFQNIHYYAAGASYFGSAAVSGFEYRPSASYAGQNNFPAHGGGAPVTCTECHLRGADADHNFLPRTTDCQPCHTGTTFPTLTGSPSANYDAIYGTGGLLEDTLTAIEAFALTLPSGAIAYDDHTYPYWFIAGQPAEFANRYQFGIDPMDAMYVPTPADQALYAACYNYQFGAKEPGSYIHNGDYMGQILYDALDQMDDGLQNDSVMGHTRP